MTLSLRGHCTEEENVMGNSAESGPPMVDRRVRWTMSDGDEAEIHKVNHPPDWAEPNTQTCYMKPSVDVSRNRVFVPGTMTNVNQAPLPRLSKAPLVRASLVKRRYIKYLALPFYDRCHMDVSALDDPWMTVVGDWHQTPADIHLIAAAVPDREVSTWQEWSRHSGRLTTTWGDENAVEELWGSAYDIA